MSDNDEARAGEAPKPQRRERAAEGGLLQELLGQFSRAIDSVDIATAAARVARLRAEHPGDSDDAIVERLIRDACVRTGAVGAATSGAALIPGIGTLASLTVGVAADIGATFRIQAELVVEIAAARGHALSEAEKRTVVMAITGVSGGANRALSRAGQRATVALTERYAAKWVSHALPFVGVGASAAVNVLTTYLVGKRADAYLQLGPEAAGSWPEIWRAITGVDERAVGGWFADNARGSWRALRGGTAAAGTTLASGASSVAGAISGAGQAIGGAVGGAGRRARDAMGAIGRLARRPKDQR